MHFLCSFYSHGLLAWLSSLRSSILAARFLLDGNSDWFERPSSLIFAKACRWTSSHLYSTFFFNYSIRGADKAANPGKNLLK